MFQVIQEIVQALNSAKYDDSSLILFSGLGNVFCNGVDLLFLLSGERRVVVRQMVDALRFVILFVRFQSSWQFIAHSVVTSWIVKNLILIRNIEEYFIYFNINFPDPFDTIIGNLTFGVYSCNKIQAMS